MAYNTYFTKFPLVSYSNNVAIDITRKVKFVENSRQNPYLFFPYTIQHNERADQIADKTYDDPYYDWMIYLANEIVDPYYGYYLNETEFDNLLIKKYGSIENSFEKVMYWRNNWDLSDEITIAAFNALVPERKKYWTPVFRDERGVILSYKRKQNDWSFNTNRLVKYVVSGNHTFQYDEMVVIKDGSTVVGQGEIEYANKNNIILKNVQNTYNYIGTMSSRTGTSSVSITSATDIQGTGITPLELAYYSPVNAYEFEREKNEYNKTLILTRPEHAYDVNEYIEQLLEANVNQ